MVAEPNNNINQIDVAFFLVPGFSMMALSAAVEPLRALNRLIGERRYSWQIVARENGPVAASNGFEINAPFSIETAPVTELTIVVASIGVQVYNDRAVFEWLRRRRGGGRAVGAVSNGTLLLARAQLLDGRAATIHWEKQRQFAEEFPEVIVKPDLYCVEDDILTAAGGTATFDLMLAWIARHDGHDAAADVAEQFLHGALREPDAVQRSDAAWRYQVTDKRLLSAIELMECNIEHPLRISQLAGLAGTSERQLERLFGENFKWPLLNST
ncbi:MAG: GlxA family transcriptional regulator [Hyphomicrobiales bacterium]